METEEEYVSTYFRASIRFPHFFENCINDSLIVKEIKKDAFLQCAEMFFLVSIDDDEVLDLDYTYFTHYIEDRMGFNTIFATDGLNKGNHVLEIKSPIYKQQFGSKGVIDSRTLNNTKKSVLAFISI